jgi:hypothetical protein
MVAYAGSVPHPHPTAYFSRQPGAFKQGEGQGRGANDDGGCMPPALGGGVTHVSERNSVTAAHAVANHSGLAAAPRRRRGIIRGTRRW